MALLLVAFGAIIIWFILAPFLKPSPATEPQEVDPRVTCALCDELRELEDVIEREFGAGRYQFICRYCLTSMVDEFEAAHGAPQDGVAEDSDSGQ